MFVRSIWEYQWIRNKVELTAGMLDAIYEETQGIIVLAVILYVLLQEDAILSEKETFGLEDIRRVAVNKMGLVQPMLEALRKNDQKLIDQYEDITDILLGKVEAGLCAENHRSKNGLKHYNFRAVFIPRGFFFGTKCVFRNILIAIIDRNWYTNCSHLFRLLFLLFKRL